jgi:hypothetical protein
MDDGGWLPGVFFGAVIGAIFVMVALAVLGVPAAGKNGYCAALGGEYNTELRACVIDNQVVEVVDWSKPIEEN